jgi:hypothetical protein
MISISGRLFPSDAEAIREENDDAMDEDDTGDDTVMGITDSKISYSGFKMADVKKSLTESIHGGKLEPACYWSAEMVCSGQIAAFWEMVITYYAKFVHLANPALAVYMDYRWTQFDNDIRPTVVSEEMCNEGSIRRLVCEVVCMLCISKKAHALTVPRVILGTMFDDDRYRADHSRYSESFIGEGDPPELSIPVNELAYQLTQVVSHLAEASYWIEWLITYFAVAKRNKQPLAIVARPWVPVSVDRRLHNHPIWVIWDVVLQETRLRHDALLSQYINALLHLFCAKLSVGGLKKKRPLIHMAAALLTQPFVRVKHLMPDDIAVSLAMDNISVIYRQIRGQQLAK